MMTREEYHKLLDLCADVTEKTEYRVNLSAYNAGSDASVWVFKKNRKLKLSYLIFTPEDLHYCIKCLEELLNEPERKK